jgi:DNA modification methylase
MPAKTRTRPGDLKVEWWPIERPIPYSKNPRVCPQSAIDKVAASIEQFSFRQAIVVDSDDTVVVGHTRLLAAKQLGLKQVPVHVAADLSPAQAAAYRIADNRTNEETSWDTELLSVEISKLCSLDYDIDVLGFAADELTELLAQPTIGLVDPDEVPSVPQEPISRPGDLWHLGNHTLLCGDSTSPTDVARLMAGERASLMATDPPYLVNYDGGNHPPTWANGGKQPGAAPDSATKHWDSYVDHDTAVAFYEQYLNAAVEYALTTTPVIYMCFGMMRAPLVFEAWGQAGLLLHQVLVWNKSRVVLSRSDYCWNYEPIAYGWIKGARPRTPRRPPANAKAVWEISSAILDGPQEHPTCKPVELVTRPIDYHTKPGELIYEPFSGSGTAIIAAEIAGRRCFALEISPAYCDVTVKRWEAFSGKTAARNGTLD